MIFDDLFYPGNPVKREQVALLRGGIVSSFNNFKRVWNEHVNLLNGIFKVQKAPFNIQLKDVSYDVTKETINDCVIKINTAFDYNGKALNKLITDLGIDKQLPTNWDESGIRYDPSSSTSILEIGKTLSTVLIGGLGGYIGYHLFKGITIFLAIKAAVTGIRTGFLCFLGGALGGLIIGGAAFIIGDIIASAITGAIQRRELNSAISVLTECKEKVADQLDTINIKVAAITQCVKDGLYRLDDTHILLKQPDGSYVILSTVSAVHMPVKARAASSYSLKAKSILSENVNCITIGNNLYSLNDAIPFISAGN